LRFPRAGVFALSARPSSTGTASSDGSSTEETRQHWRTAVQGRFHPLAFGLVVPWAGVELGSAALRAHQMGSTPAGGEEFTDTEWAEAFGGGIGLDGWLSEGFALSGQLWLLYVGFDGTRGALPEPSQTNYHSRTWFTLGLGARFLL
jgi:hypothetical protein